MGWPGLTRVNQKKKIDLPLTSENITENWNGQQTEAEVEANRDIHKIDITSQKQKQKKKQTNRDNQYQLKQK